MVACAPEIVFTLERTNTLPASFKDTAQQLHIAPLLTSHSSELIIIPHRATRKWFSRYKWSKDNMSGTENFLLLRHVALGTWMGQMSIQTLHTQRNCQIRNFSLILASLFNVCFNTFCYFHVVSTQLIVSTIEIRSFLFKKLEILVMREISTVSAMKRHTHCNRYPKCSSLNAPGMKLYNVPRQKKLLVALRLYWNL